MALCSMRGVSLGFGGHLVLEEIDLQIEQGERLGLVGRNGVGKSTLLKLVAGELEPEAGHIVRERGVKVAYLVQEVPEGTAGTVGEVIERGLPPADPHGMDEQGWKRRLLLDTIVARMQLEVEADFSQLSAGLKRRVMLAQGLVRDPDIVLLDEPTNHLDLDAIAWMEDYLLRYGGTLVFVTHDRTFLRRLATRIIEIDRGRLIDWACDYDTFAMRKQSVLEAEATQQAEFDKKLAQEEAWIRQGIEARRTRNEGRVRALERLRNQRSERRERPGALRIQAQEAERSGKLVLRAEGVSYSYGDGKPVVRDFSTTIMRGDKVGIVGPNGSGKTTLLRLLIGDIKPESGTVRHGSNLEIAYFDQLRAQLDEDATVFENVAEGRDFVTINGRRRHIMGYLLEFLFPAERARAYVSTLSGGERNRLLLARLFARPANLLVLDEPTNDLDLETLGLLEDLLLNFEGTLLLVSHDRELLNNVVDGTLALEPGGRIGEYAGGYDDWVRQRPNLVTETVKKSTLTPPSGRPAPAAKGPKLTYRERQELDALPGQIEALESEQATLYAAMADVGTYQAGGDEVVRRTARLAEVEAELVALYARWETLEGKAG
jgi:ABC transport system ATP-binding/permease protein